MQIAAKANALTVGLADRNFCATAFPGATVKTKRPSQGPVPHKHHDSGFRGLEFGSKVTESKRTFNANSSSLPARHEAHPATQTDYKQKETINPLTGASMVKYEAARQTHARKTLLPPQKRYDNDGTGKREYRENLSRQPRTFHRQNGDFTYF